MRPFLRSWLLAPLLVLTLVAWLHTVRLQRVRHLTALPEWSVEAPTIARSSPTGYANGCRALVVPDRLGQSQQWIAQTQTMLDRGTWRLRRVDYDNAPFGRDTHLPALYRGWLGALAVVHAEMTGLPHGLAVERVALYADPLLQLLCALLLAWFVRREFGPFAAALVVIAWLTLYPLATSWLPGAPDPQGLTQACVLWSVLPLVAAVWRAAGERRTRPVTRLVLGASAAGGLGLWLNPNIQVPVLAGVAGGAIACAWFSRRANGEKSAAVPELPWRLWGLAGGAVSLLAYALEYYPDALAMRHPGNHPLHALAWVALGELLQHLAGWVQRGSRRPLRSEALAGSVALFVLAGIVIAAAVMHAGGSGADLAASRLTRIGEGLTASSFGSWVSKDGFSLRVFTTVAPVVLLFAAARSFLRRSPLASRRHALALALGPAVVALALAFPRVREWNTVGSIVLALLAVVTAEPAGSSSRQWPWAAATAFVAALGLLSLIPPRTLFRAEEFTPAEMQALVERDLAHWLAQRNPAAIVFAPPTLTTSLWFHGGVRGIATFDADNREGFLGGLRIAAAPTDQEALALLRRRGVTHVVLPTDDRSFDQAARESAEGNPNARLPEGVERKMVFIEKLREWLLPLWLRPIAAVTPKIGGFGPTAAIVFEIVEEQRESALLAQMATYFVEAEMPGHAAALRPFLSRHPTDLGALVALAEIELARGDERAFAAALSTVVSALDARADRYLPWERRVALAAVLARGGRDAPARAQTQLCFARAGIADVSALSPRSLHRLLALGRHYRVEFTDDTLSRQTPSLLPPDFRAALR